MLDSCLYLEITTFAATRVVLFQILKFASFRSLNRARTHTHNDCLWPLIQMCGASGEMTVIWGELLHQLWGIPPGAFAALRGLLRALLPLSVRQQVNTMWTPCEHLHLKVDRRWTCDDTSRDFKSTCFSLLFSFDRIAHWPLRPLLTVVMSRSQSEKPNGEVSGAVSRRSVKSLEVLKRQNSLPLCLLAAL